MKAAGVLRLTGGQKQIGALFFFMVLTLLMTYPLVTHVTTGVLGPPGDNFEYLYKLWWFKQALFEQEVSPFYTANVFYPEGYHLAMHEMSLANVALGMPLALLGDEVLAFNSLALLSFLLSGFGAYLLAFWITCDRIPSLVTGMLFSFASYRMAHLGAGHLNLLGTQWLPFLVLELDLLLRTRELLPAMLVGIFFAMSALSSWYYAPMFALFAGAYLLIRARKLYSAPPGALASAGDAPVWRLLVVSGLISGILIAPGLVQTLQQWRQGQMSFSLREVDMFSASLGDWIVPNIMHPLLGRWFADYFADRQDVLEYLISLSWSALGLAALALWPARRGLIGEERVRRSVPLVVLFVLCFVLALGTTLHSGGERVYVSVPDWVEERFTQGVGLLANRLAPFAVPSYYELRMPGAVYIPLPALLLYLYLPGFSAMRVWTRFGVLSAFVLAVLAGLGLVRLKRILSPHALMRRRAAKVAWVCLATVFLELLAIPYPLGWSEVRAQPVDEWLAGQVGRGAIIQFPLWRAECGPGLYSSTVHGKPLAYGYGPFFPSYYRQARAALWSFPSAASIAVLREWGVQYVLVRAQAYGEQWADLQEQLGQIDALVLAEIIPSEPVYHSGWLAESLPDFGQALLVDDVYVYEMSGTTDAAGVGHVTSVAPFDRL